MAKANTNRPESPTNPQTPAPASNPLLGEPVGPLVPPLAPQSTIESAKSFLEVLNAPTAPTNVSPETPTPKPAARQGDEGRPYCALHQCLMQANGTRGDVTNYRCPVPTCTCTTKRARPSVQIAREPLLCPNRTCQEPQQYLEIDLAKSGAMAHMQCPKCKFSMKVPRPQFAQSMQQHRRRPPRENLDR